MSTKVTSSTTFTTDRSNFTTTDSTTIIFPTAGSDYKDWNYNECINKKTAEMFVGFTRLLTDKTEMALALTSEDKDTREAAQVLTDYLKELNKKED